MKNLSGEIMNLNNSTIREYLKEHAFTSLESDIAILIAKGLTDKEIVSQLFVTEKAVKSHLSNIYKKLDVKSRAQFIVKCFPHLGLG